jgi:hypothetical protein
VSEGSVLRDMAMATSAWASPLRTRGANPLAWTYVGVKSTIRILSIFSIGSH